MTKLKVVSLFAGAGGLDLGFKNAGFDIVWANEFDKDIWETYEKNNPNTKLDRRSITEVPSSDIPECDGIIGGPPCQSWSAAGNKKGFEDKKGRGKLFFEFIRVLEDKRPKFFLAENVAGMLAKRHEHSLDFIKELFRKTGYNLHFKLLNASDYGVPQDRKRVIFIGIRKDLDVDFSFPEKSTTSRTLKDAICDLHGTEVSALEKNYSNPNCNVINHEYFIGGFSSMYMSRNRVRDWNSPSFTIQAGGRHAPLHPQAPAMEPVKKDVKRFVPGKEHLYRRLSVRECARVQTFPDEHVFYYSNLTAAYKMIGNAVPVKFAEALAGNIKESLKQNRSSSRQRA